MTSIYEHIRAHLASDGSGLLPEGEELPDEQPDGGGVRWAPGALAGVLGHHFGESSDQEDITLSLNLITRTVSDGFTTASFNALYEQLKSDLPLSALDALLDKIRNADLPSSDLQALGRRLAAESRHRNPVKAGIAILGISESSDQELLFTLGLHDEFTLFSAVAIARTNPDPGPVLWELAKSVHGWGRIEIVSRLRNTKRPEIQQWILRGGFRNSVMNEYLAYIAATTGGLFKALSVPEIDRELLDAAGDIVTALINGGPAEDIDDYDEASLAVSLLIGHLEQQASELKDFLVVDDIEHFLARDDWKERYLRGWSAEQQEDLRLRCQMIKKEPHWLQLATDGLTAQDDLAFYRADRVARKLGVDVYPARWRRLLDNPGGSPWDWGQAVELADDKRITEIIALAEKILPLKDIATGPGRELGFGPKWKLYSALDQLLLGLKRFPGKGWTLIATGLASPVVRNRNLAVAALETWSPEHWQPMAKAELEKVTEVEPDVEIRERMRALVKE